MSFSFASLLASAESALASIMPVIQPLEKIATTLAPVVETLIPATAPIINAVEKGAASITAIAPTAVQDATTVIAVGKKIVSDGAPLLAELEAVFNSIFHVQQAGQSIVLTPKTTAATAPAS